MLDISKLIVSRAKALEDEVVDLQGLHPDLEYRIRIDFQNAYMDLCKNAQWYEDVRTDAVWVQGAGEFVTFNEEDE